MHMRRMQKRTSRSGKASFSSRMVRCERPSSLNASSAVEVLRWSGVLGKMTTWVKGGEGGRVGLHQHSGTACAAALFHFVFPRVQWAGAKVDCCTDSTSMYNVHPSPPPHTQETRTHARTWLTPSERASATWSTTFLPNARR
jgi:hypothetical protein